MTVFVLSHERKWLTFGSYHKAHYVTLEKAKFYSTEKLARNRQNKGSWIGKVHVNPKDIKVHKISLQVVRRETLP